MVRSRLCAATTAVLAMTFALLMLGVWASTTASAEPVLVAKDADGNVIVTMTATGESVSGQLSVVNPTARVLAVQIRGNGPIARCTFALTTLPPSSTTDVTVKSDQCGLSKNGESATMTFTGRTTSSVALSLKLKSTAKSVSLGASLVAFVVAAIGTLVLFALTWRSRPKRDGKRLEWGDQLTGLPSGWSFKDSWATNIGAISTVFVAIFGTNDAIKALVGDESDSLPGRLLIIAGISGLLIGVAPVVLKAIGPSSTVKVSGLLAAAFLTTTAIAGQVLAVYTAFGVTDPTGSPGTDFTRGFGWNTALWVTLGLLAVLVWYVYSTVRALLTPGEDAPPTPSDELLVASATLVAAQVCCESGREPDMSPRLLEIAYVRAVNLLVVIKGKPADRPGRDPGRPVAPPRQGLGGPLPGEPLPGEPLPGDGGTGQEPELYSDLDAILARSASARDIRSALL